MFSIADQSFTNRLILGTALYPSPEVMLQSIVAAKVELITVSIRRQMPSENKGKQFWQLIKQTECKVLPNTAGCHSAQDAVTTAEMAREIFETNWVKLEIIGDDYNLQPDSIQLLTAVEDLLQRGFIVLPYCTDDLVVAKYLVDLGCRIIMPWAAPIGTGQGIINKRALSTLRERLPTTTLIIDAGLGLPSHAAYAMELGFDAVLLNSAVALAQDPVKMAQAFSSAVIAGRLAYEAGSMPERDLASPSTPVLDTPFWQQEIIDE